MPPKVSINLVVWNNYKYLEGCLQSVFAQTFTDYEVIVIDNASQDGSVEYIKKNFPQVILAENKKNRGFSGAHNQAIRISRSEFVLVINPDIVLEKDFLEKLVNSLKKMPKIGSIGGKLLKMQFSSQGAQKTNILDSLGLVLDRKRRVSELGCAQKDDGQFNGIRPVFGVSGALVMYRRKALEQIKHQNMYSEEYFDEDFFAYKEDVDMAWRLRSYGWENIIDSSAVAYHFRQSSDSDSKMSNVKTFFNRQNKSGVTNYLSYRNHIYLLLKNESLGGFIKNSPFILFYECKKIIYLILFERKTLKAWADILRNYKKMKNKRRGIFFRVKLYDTKKIRGKV